VAYPEWEEFEGRGEHEKLKELYRERVLSAVSDIATAAHASTAFPMTEYWADIQRKDLETAARNLAHAAAMLYAPLGGDPRRFLDTVKNGLGID
jgi:hypothetical protein